MYSINDQYLIHSRLGKGKYGQVYKGFSKSKNKFVAVKQLLHNVQKIWDSDEKIRRQVEIMKRLNHPNILKLLDIVRIPEKIYIVLEFCDGGDLRQYMNKEKSLSQLRVFQIFCQIVTGMAEVNRQDCFHRDLKPENIMLMNDGTVKLGDFGFARAIIGNDIAKLQSYTAVGSPIYAAPNVCMGQMFSALCDVWSVGCILYELLVGKNLFAEVNNLSTLRIAQKKFETHPFQFKEKKFHPFFAQYLPKMITYNELDRISFQELQNYLNENQQRIINQISTNVYLNKTEKTEKPQKPLISTEQPILSQPAKGKIKIINHPQNNPYKTESKNLGTNTEKIVHTQIKQKNYQISLEFFKYIDYIYNRAVLFTELTKRLNLSTNYPIQNIYKYLLMYLSLGIFVNTVEEALILLSSNTIKLPNGKKLILDEFDEKSKIALKGYIDEHTKKLINEKNKYLATILAIQTKVGSNTYKTKYPNAYIQYQDVIKTLQQVNNQNKLQNSIYLEKNFRLILSKNGRVNSESVESNIRIYYMCLFMVFYRDYMDETEFLSIDKINKFRAEFEKMDISVIKKNIQQLENKL